MVDCLETHWTKAQKAFPDCWDGSQKPSWVKLVLTTEYLLGNEQASPMQRQWRRMGLEGKTGSERKGKFRRNGGCIKCLGRYFQLLDRPGFEVAQEGGMQLRQRGFVLAAGLGLYALFSASMSLYRVARFRLLLFFAATGAGGQQHRRPFLSLPIADMGKDRDADVRQQDEGGKVVCEDAVQHDESERKCNFKVVARFSI